MRVARLAAALPLGRCLERLAIPAIRAVRRHPLAAAATIGVASGLLIALGQGIGEHAFGNPGTAIRLVLLFTLVTAATFFGFLVAAGAYLRVVRREAVRLDFPGRVALRATIAATASVPLTVAFRFWIHAPLHAVTRGGGLPALIALVAVLVWIAAVVAQLAWRRARLPCSHG
jgi:hypothetical protein